MIFRIRLFWLLHRLKNGSSVKLLRIITLFRMTSVSVALFLILE